MFLAPLLRWGSFLSIALAVAVALALSVLSAHPEPLGFLTSSSSLGSVANASTYCYRGIRTHDHDNPSAQCFTVVNGTFARVWSDGADTDTGTGTGAGTGTELLDGYVIPGLWDGHGHLMAWGEFLHSVDLFAAQNMSEVRSRLRAHLRRNPGAGTRDSWLRGAGWDQDLYGGRMPTADDIDEDPALRGIFMMLDRNDGHCVWVSRPVLDMLPPDMPETPGGQIIREPGPGVFCDDAMDPVMQLWPKASDETRTRLVRDAMRDLNSVGLVGVHDASTLPADVALYNRLADGEDWTVRVYAMLECDSRNSYCPGDATRIARSDSRFWLQSVKLFAGTSPAPPPKNDPKRMEKEGQRRTYNPYIHI